jgi:hypothetical protein
MQMGKNAYIIVVGCPDWKDFLETKAYMGR